MIPPRLLTKTVNLVAQGVASTDVYGNEILGETDRLDDVPAWVEQAESKEMGGDRYTVTSMWRVIFNDPGAAVIAIDDLSLIEYGSEVWEVVGIPDRKDTPRGVHHYEVLAKEVTR